MEGWERGRQEGGKGSMDIRYWAASEANASKFKGEPSDFGAAQAKQFQAGALPPTARSGVKRQLLQAPVEQFGDVQFILGRTGDLVNPAELLELFAGATEPATHFPIE